MKTAMRAKDTARLSAIRLLLAAMKQKEVDERVELTDADVAGDHREDDQAAARVDRPVREGRRATTSPTPRRPRSACSRRYLPQQLGEAEVGKAIAAAIAESGAAGVKDMGKVMALLKPRLAGARRHGQGFRRWSKPSLPG